MKKEISTRKQFKVENDKDEVYVQAEDYSHSVNISKEYDATFIRFVQEGKEVHVNVQLCGDKLGVTIWKEENVWVELKGLNFVCEENKPNTSRSKDNKVFMNIENCR